jgi:hypothetical protein
MWLAYIDESYNAAQHWVAAVLVQHQHVNEAQRALRDVSLGAGNNYGVPFDAELHGYEIFQGAGAFECMTEMHRARIGIYGGALRCLSEAPCSIILRGVNKTGLRRRYGVANAPEPHRVTMTHLIERVDEFCAARNDHALLVADEHHEAESALLRDLRTYQEGATWGYRARRITRVIDTIHFVRSSTNPLVQGADLVAFLARRMKAHEEPDERAQAANARLWAILEPHVHHDWCWHP